MTNQPNRPKSKPPKSEEEILENIVATFSKKRIASYHTKDSKKALRLYQINIMLCQALYPSLNCLEIALRNSIDRVVSTQYGKFWFFPNHEDFIDKIENLSESIFTERRQKEKENVQRLYFSTEHIKTFFNDENLFSPDKKELENVGKSLKKYVERYYDNQLNGQAVSIEFKLEDRNKIISGLSLGFWVALLYKNKYWKIRNLNQEIFGDAQRKDLSRYDSEKKETLFLFKDYLEEIRKLRNRVFHHNQILQEDLQTKHTRILNIIGWISKDTKSWLNDIDNFNEVYEKYENEIKSWKKDIGIIN